MQPDQAVINRWSGAAPFWEKHRELIREMFEPVTEALVQDARIGSGHAVLDIATGPGEPALTVAGLVGPEGKVVGIDRIPGMVDAARRETERRGLTNTQFDVGSADELPFAADTFDAVLSRFGVMFFPSPEDSIRGMLRVLKPGGGLALAVWGPLEHNPFYYVTSRVIESYLGPTVPAPRSRGAVPLRRIRKVTGHSCERRRDRRLRAPATIRNRSAHVTRRVLEFSIRDVRGAAGKCRAAFRGRVRAKSKDRVIECAQ